MISIVFSLVFMFFSTVAKAGELPWNEMQTLGTAKFNVAFWDIYEARLYVSGEHYTTNSPYALKLTYLRKIKQEKLIEETKNQLKITGSYNPKKIEQWTAELTRLWRDVEKGDSITLYVDNDQHSHFYINDLYSGVIRDSEFSQSFSGIWLSKNTSEPKLRLALIGATINE